MTASRRSAASFAAGVSRALKAGGVMTTNPESQYRRDGVFVTGSAIGAGVHASVRVAIVDDPQHEKVLLAEATRILEARGYDVQPYADTFLQVTRPEVKP